MRNVEKMKSHFDKKKNKLLIYNNHTGTQRVFYHQTAQHNFYVDTNLLRLTKTVKDSEILDLKPNSDAFYHLVTIGYILGHISPLKNFFRLLEGSIILMDNISGYYEIKHYFDDHYNPIQLTIVLSAYSVHSALLSVYPSATSSIIIRENPMAKKRVPMLECSPADISGMSSSTTT